MIRKTATDVPGMDRAPRRRENPIWFMVRSFKGWAILDLTYQKPPPSRKIEDKAQYERFREFAREVEADDDPEAFDRKFRKIVPPRPT